MDHDLSCTSDLLTAATSPSSEASMMFDGLRMTTPPTHPDSTSDASFSDVFYMSDVNSVLLPDIDTILPCHGMGPGISSEENLTGIEVAHNGDPWDSLSSDPFATLGESSVFGPSEHILHDFSQPPIPLASTSDFAGSFVVTCSDSMCPCDGLALRRNDSVNVHASGSMHHYPKAIALDCDVIGVTRVVSDKGCQSYVNLNNPVEVPEVDSSTGSGRDRSKECTLCCKSFTRLDKHVKYVHGSGTGTGKKNCECKDKKPKAKGTTLRSCRICNESFPKYSLLRAHMRANHPEEVETVQATFPPCKYCGRKFNSEMKLRDHIVSHSGKYRYQCDLCEKGFAVVTDLQRHRRTHTGDRPYSCELCAKQFTQSGSLNRHKRNVHKIIIPKTEN